MICADASEDEEKTGRMYCCLYCATVIHKKCGIKHDRSDFPHDDDESEWVTDLDGCNMARDWEWLTDYLVSHCHVNESAIYSAEAE